MTKESSSELSSLAARVLNKGKALADAPPSEFNDLLADAKRLAGSVLSQDETPGYRDQEDHDERASRGDLLPGDGPEANAPAPDAMHTELVNILLSKAGGKVMRPKAEAIVTAMLEKQMAFYAQMADPELTASPEEQMAVVTEMMGLGQAVVLQGAAMVNHMLPADQEKWRSTVARYRDAMTKMAEMFS